VDKIVNIDKVYIRNLTILLGSSLTVLAGILIAPSLPGMALAFQDVHNADFLVKLALTMPALLTAIFAPLIGFILDRWGRKPILILSLILYGIAGSSGFVLNTLTGILISRAILGISVAGILVGFTTLIADYFTGAKLHQFMGYQGASIGLGGVVFLLISGYLADIGWRLCYTVGGAAFC
jgi:MFS family permease